MRINVKDGTNAGWRIVKKPLLDWTCMVCTQFNKHYWATCSGCNTRRPNDPGKP